ncbi:MAG: hypothetical protein JO056_02010 [Alphaproteobacteria bacterium]|nr:hypothetical protein [Alphaproteobacteria bacterium]
MTKTVLLAGAAMFALTGASYAGAPKAGVSGHFAKHVVFGVPAGSKTLYDQNNNDSGVANTSQNFESSFDQYDNMGADDFVVPKGHTWTVKEVDVTGQYRYSGGSALTANVAFYKNKKGLPGAVVASCDNAKTGDKNATGSFKIKLAKCAPALKAGKYFVSVQANLDFSNPAAQWYWDTNTTPAGAAAAWQDPNGGWAALGVPADCNTWQTLAHCLGSTGDWMFALKGTDS